MIFVFLLHSPIFYFLIVKKETAHKLFRNNLSFHPEAPGKML